jgi:hypothetical protein
MYGLKVVINGMIFFSCGSFLLTEKRIDLLSSDAFFMAFLTSFVGYPLARRLLNN